MFQKVINFIQKTFKSKKFIPLHQPIFMGNEKKNLNKCIDSSFVSSVGKFTEEFENKMADYVGAKYAVATCNGTAALHIALLLANVDQDDEVITQPLNFVATCNAINYCGAQPIFVDVDIDTMGLSPSSLEFFLKKNTKFKNKRCVNKNTGKIIKACVPMHSYGHPCRIDEIKKICKKYNIFLIEDGAESVGSHYKSKHTGTFGEIGTMSFNGNKIITAGGGGCIITNNKVIAKKAKHLTTTAKLPHEWEFNHNMIGYNYRMPNINAALLLAQLENLENYIVNKRDLASKYKAFFNGSKYIFFQEPKNCKSNYWLNSIILKDKKERDRFLKFTNKKLVMTRPIWRLMNELEMFKSCHATDLKNAIYLQKRVVNIPSSVRI